MATARVKVIHEAKLDYGDGYYLCFQWGKYRYDDGSSEHGYRFMWRYPERAMSHRGQARIPNAKDLLLLLSQAADEGWFVKCESEPDPAPE